MNNLPGVNEVFELLDRLKSTVRNFAAREEKLSADCRAQSTAETKAYELATRKLAAQRADDIAGAEAVLATAKHQALARFEKFKTRIHQAHRTSRKQALEAVDQGEGRRKYQLQKSVMETDHRRETDLANAAARVAEYKQKLGEIREAFARHEASIHKAFRGYAKFRRWLSPDRIRPEPDLSLDEYRLREELLKLHDQLDGGLRHFRKMLWPRLFGGLSLWLLVVLLLLGHAALIPVLQHFEVRFISYREIGVSQFFWLAVIFIGYAYGRRQAGPAALALATDLAKARRYLEACREKSEIHYQQELERIKNDGESARRSLDKQWEEAVREAVEARTLRPRQIDEKEQRIARQNEHAYHAKLEQLERRHADTVARLRQTGEARQQQLAAGNEAALAKIKANFEEQWRNLETEWTRCIQPVWESIQAAEAGAKSLFPDWRHPQWETWSPPTGFTNAAKLGRLEVDLELFAESIPQNLRLALPGPPTFSVPLLLTFPRQGSALFETTKTGAEDVVKTINNILFRVLTTTPPGKVAFTIIDPVGLGQSFAGLMHLADYSESYVNGRIWTQTQQIEEKLAELNEHMEKVIQMYLRNEYATIAEYNAQAGVIAEKYHLLVIAGFPVNFNETAARRLLNIAASGARCGVFTLIHWDHRHTLPHDFIPDELRKNSVGIGITEGGFTLAGRRLAGLRLLLDAPPPPELATRLLHQVGQSGRDANRVEVPFDQVAPAEPLFWSADTTEELRVPIGRAGATKLQELAIGKGTRQHVLIAGKTGSGKSTLFHVIITNLALWCSPEQVEFYLVDFKKGVEFKCYATRQLPHARVVAIESDREFGLSVLQRVDDELRRRGDLFRKLGVQDLAGFKKAGGDAALPRSLLIIDEFQEFFVEEDRISQNAAALLDRIVRQGRAFGIHVLLGSQTLGGAYTLARATLGQMVIRIALQCNEADAYLIMDESNAAPRLLSRPGEGIYNDAAGSLEGNSPFQTVWLSDEVRDAFLAKIRQRADRGPLNYPSPMVFEGNAPAEVRENRLLRGVLETPPAAAAASARLWFGAPNSIKGPTEAVFQRQSRNHLLIVGQREEAVLAILSVGLIALAAQYPAGTVRFIWMDSTPPASPQREFLDRVIRMVPQAVTRPKTGELGEIMSGLAEELKSSSGAEDVSMLKRTFLFIHRLENYRKLRQEDEFSFATGDSDAGPNPAAQLATLLSEGSSHGMHVIATCDTYNNVTRFLGRKALSEIALRVLFQMSAADSANLIDAPDAGNLGLHRALFFNDQEGFLETFRPYALPGNDWLEEAARLLTRRR